jgi:protein-S-isoprenylcysteine O-methyltransferase Ste14
LLANANCNSGVLDNNSPDIAAILLAIPLAVIVVISAPYWIKFKDSSKRETAKQEIPYNKIFLSLVGLCYFCIWPLIPALCVIVGMYPTAKTEEKVLIERFGEEYIEYQRKVGMFFPRLF